MMKGAVLSEDKLYRYRLMRSWNDKLPSATFIMLNPSTADANEDDPTIRKIVRQANSWGFGRLEVVNLFAYRSTEASVLKDLGRDVAVGKNNDTHILEACRSAAKIVCAWGNWGKLYDNRGQQVVDLLVGLDLHAFGTNNTGQPVHPLYQFDDAETYVWRTADRSRMPGKES